MRRALETAVGMQPALCIRAGGRWGPYSVGRKELVDVPPVKVFCLGPNMSKWIHIHGTLAP